MWRKKNRRHHLRWHWFEKLRSAIHSCSIRVSIWLSVKAANISPLRLRMWFLVTGFVFILYNGWHIVNGLRRVHQLDKAASFLVVSPIGKDTIAHTTTQSTAVKDSTEFSAYLDSMAKVALLDSVYSVRPGLRDSIALIKHFYHIK